MREIKFRAWDKQQGYMLEPFIIGIMPEKAKSGWSITGEGIYISPTEQARFILLQFTGLKDKNGREIYEGDIIESQMGQLYEVLWEGIGWNPFVDNMIDSYKSYRLEVIGSIYENPELLEVGRELKGGKSS
jgi:hypothetical protein